MDGLKKIAYLRIAKKCVKKSLVDYDTTRPIQKERRIPVKIQKRGYQLVKNESDDDSSKRYYLGHRF